MPANIALPSNTAVVTSSLAAISSGDMLSKCSFLSDIVDRRRQLLASGPFTSLTAGLAGRSVRLEKQA
jgi:hypothetical protein